VDFLAIYKSQLMLDNGTWTNQIGALNTWAASIVASNPFGLPGTTVPWTDLSGASGLGGYVTLTLKQLAYIAIIVLHGGQGSGDTPFQNSLKEYTFYSVMSFLMGIKDNPDIDLINVAATQGGWSPDTAQSKVQTDWKTLPLAPVNVCEFDSSKISVSTASGADVLDSKFCVSDSPTGEGHDYMSDDIPGQSLVDIMGAFFCGGDSCTGCNIANTQDESVALFYPETTVLSFFSTNRESKVLVPRTLLFLGVRKYINRQSGSHTNTGTCGKIMEPRPINNLMSSTVVAVPNVGTEAAVKLQFYDHSVMGVASCCVNCYNSGNNDKQSCVGGSGAQHPIQDIFTWFGAFSPLSYADFLQPVVKSVVRRAGTGPWGAGVWLGDTQQYFLITWAGTSLVPGLTLDYFQYQCFCERNYEGCGLLEHDECVKCWAGNICGQYAGSPRCGQKGAKGFIQTVQSKTVGDLYDFLSRTQTLSGGQLFDQPVDVAPAIMAQ